jgi:raffinose/stachyose/melibiose transport system substrate-binding protein
MLAAGCTPSVPAPGGPEKRADLEGREDWRWHNPNDYGKSLNPGREYRIRMLAGVYHPGGRPGGFGPYIKQMRLLADEYEATHPDVTIEFPVQAVVAGGSEGEWLRTQLLGGVAPEIVALNTEAVWPDIGKGWWISFEPYLEQPNPYVPGNDRWLDTFAHKAFTLSRRGPDGQLYCIPYDMCELAIFYNKDIFRKVGINVPQTWAEFLDIQQKLEDEGYIPFLAYLKECGQDWGPDLLFDQFYYPILEELDYLKGSPDEEAYMRGYLMPQELCWNIKRGWFVPDDPLYAESWRLLREWRRYWQKDLSHSDLWRLFVTERAPMIWDGSWFLRRMNHDPLVDFEWDVFYPPTVTKASSPFGSGVDPSVMGGGAMQYHVTNSAMNKEGKLERVIDFMMFLTKPENCEKVVNEAGMFIPNIEGARMVESLQPFAEIVKRRYCSVKWIYSLDHDFNDVHMRMIHLYLGYGLTLDAFMERMGVYFNEAADRMIRRYQWAYVGPPDEKAQAAAERLGVPYEPKLFPVRAGGGSDTEPAP